MNYYIDFIPDSKFLEFISEEWMAKQKNNKIFMNIYIKQLPAMSLKKDIYLDIKFSKDYICDLKKIGYYINLMFDAFCLGNKEFTDKGNEYFKIIDEIIKLDVDYITVTNNFIYNYIKRRHKEQKVILSEYLNINNAQKVDRYLNDLKSDGVKIDIKLIKDYEKMKNIAMYFPNDVIHIDTNKVYFDNDIYRDCLNNSLSHYVQDENWGQINRVIQEYEQRQVTLKNEKLIITNEEIKSLMELGITNYWYKCYDEINNYIEEIKRFIKM